MHKAVVEMNFREGEIFAVDKPLGWSSFDVVRKLKNLVQAKLGHGGTLDPLATGLLLLATGPYTKKLAELQNLPKEYTGTIYLGATTPSYDRETEEDGKWEISHITEEDINRTAQEMTGAQLQRPPVFSAVKINGKRAYELARKGLDADIKERTVEIYEFTITGIELPFIRFRVRCTKGTYIRSLAHDFGRKLGVGAYLYDLCRTAAGDYRLENAWNFQELVAELQRLKTQNQAYEGTQHAG